MLMTVPQYALYRNITKQAVAKAIRKGHKLPGVEKHERIGKMYLLTINKRKLKKYLEVS